MAKKLVIKKKVPLKPGPVPVAADVTKVAPLPKNVVAPVKQKFKDIWEEKQALRVEAAQKERIGKLPGMVSANPLTHFKNVYEVEDDKYAAIAFPRHEKPEKVYNYEDPANTLRLKTGKFNRATVPKPLIKDLYKAAKDTGIPPMDLIALAGQENTFGGALGSAGNPNNKRDLISGHDLGNEYEPKSHIAFFADKKLPGVAVIKSSIGWHYRIDDEDVLRKHLDKHPELLEQYNKVLAAQKKIPKDWDVYKSGAERIKKYGIQQYNANDPNYEKDVLESKSLLQQDPVLQGYLKELEAEDLKKPKSYQEGGIINQDIMKNLKPEPGYFKKGGIHIKKSHRGLLHKNLGVAKGKKIPASKLTIHKGDSPALKKRKQFAINAKKWHHEDGGLLHYQKGGILPKKSLKPETNEELREYQLGSGPHNLGGVGRKEEVQEATVAGIRAFQGNTPPKGVSQKVFDAHKAVSKYKGNTGTITFEKLPPRNKKYQDGGVGPDPKQRFKAGEDVPINRAEFEQFENNTLPVEHPLNNLLPGHRKQVLNAFRQDPTLSEVAASTMNLGMMPKSTVNGKPDPYAGSLGDNSTQFYLTGHKYNKPAAALPIQQDTLQTQAPVIPVQSLQTTQQVTSQPTSLNPKTVIPVKPPRQSNRKYKPVDPYGAYSRQHRRKMGYQQGGMQVSPESFEGYVPGDATAMKMQHGFQNGGTYTDMNAVSAQHMQANTYPVKKNKNLKKHFWGGGAMGGGGGMGGAQPNWKVGESWQAGSQNAGAVSAGLSTGSGIVDALAPADQYGVRSQGADIGGSALKGASTGLQTAGPWGALAGAAIGAVVGGIKHDAAVKKKKKALQGLARVTNAQNLHESEALLANYDNMGTGIKSFAAGGSHPHGGLHPAIPMKLVNGKWLVSAPGGYGNDGDYHFTDRSFLVERDQNNKNLKAGYQKGGTKLSVDTTGLHKNPYRNKTTQEVQSYMKGNLEYSLQNPNDSVAVNKQHAKLKQVLEYKKQMKGKAGYQGGGMASGGADVEGGNLQPISNNAYEVKGDNPQATDDVQYEDAYVDHGEVLKPGPEGTRIFSDHLTVPGKGRTFAKEAKKLEKSKSIKGNPNPNQDALIESKLKALFHTQQRLNDNSQGESTEEAMQPAGETPGRGMSEGNMFRLGGVSPTNVTYHDINPARIGSKAKEAMATGVISKKYYNIGGMAEKIFEVPGFRKELRTEPGHEPGAATFQAGGYNISPFVPDNLGQTRKSNEQFVPYPSVEAKRRTLMLGNLPSDKLNSQELKMLYNAHRNPSQPGLNTLIDKKQDELIGTEFEYARPRKPLKGYNCGGMRKSFAIGGQDLTAPYNVNQTGKNYLGWGSYKPITNPAPTGQPAAGKGSNIDWSAVAGLGASLAGNLHNAMALRNMPDVAQVSLTKGPKLKRLDYSDQRAMLKEGLNTALKAGNRNSTMRQAQEGSQAASLGEYSRAVNQMHGDVNRTNAQIGNEEAAMGWRNNLMNNQLTNQYRQDQQQRLSAIMSGESANIADVGNKIQGFVAQGNAMKLDQQKLDMNLAQLELSAPGAGYRHLIANGYTAEQAQEIMSRVGNTLSGKTTSQRNKNGGFVSNKKPLSYKMGGRLRRVC